MLVDKISKPENKESKTQRSNGKETRMKKVEEEIEKEWVEQSPRPWVKDGLESGMEDYLEMTSECVKESYCSNPSSRQRLLLIISKFRDCERVQEVHASPHCVKRLFGWIEKEEVKETFRKGYPKQGFRT